MIGVRKSKHNHIRLQYQRVHATQLFLEAAIDQYFSLCLWPHEGYEHWTKPWLCDTYETSNHQTTNGALGSNWSNCESWNNWKLLLWDSCLLDQTLWSNRSISDWTYCGWNLNLKNEENMKIDSNRWNRIMMKLLTLATLLCRLYIIEPLDLDLALPVNRWIIAVIPHENLNSKSSWKSAHKFWQFNV